PRTTKKKEPAARPGASARTSAGAKAKPAPRRAAATGRSSISRPAEPVSVKKTRSKKATREATPEPIVPPPRATAYSLDGPIPAEAGGLPKKVGALLGIGQRTLGIKTFRPGQATAFEHLLAGEDLLAVMPTGSGKSLLYQLTSLVVPGVTVV